MYIDPSSSQSFRRRKMHSAAMDACTVLPMQRIGLYLMVCVRACVCGKAVMEVMQVDGEAAAIQNQ